MAEGASLVGAEAPGVLGVTVLTSDETAGRHVLEERCELAASTGCAGIVCAAPDLPVTDPWADRLVRVVPGIRMPGGDVHDQARVATPRDALAAGADLLVVGRAVTAAPDPAAAAADLVAHLVGSDA
jgi:orotidine-5'-phosphate decarboxylase